MAIYVMLLEFCRGKEEVSAYLEQVELFFSANDVPDEKQVPIISKCIGENNTWVNMHYAAYVQQPTPRSRALQNSQWCFKSTIFKKDGLHTLKPYEYSVGLQE